MNLRPFQSEDRETYLAWARQNPDCNLDEKVLAYPLLATLVAQNGKVVSFLPTHPVLMLESMAHNPEATVEEKLEAAEKMLESAGIYATLAGISELVFLVSDEGIVKTAKRLGFYESGMKVMRKAI